MLKLEIKIHKTENISIYRNDPNFHELPLFSYNLSWKERKDIKTDYCFEIFGYGTVNNSFYYASNYCLDKISNELLTLINAAWDEVIKNNMSYLSFFMIRRIEGENAWILRKKDIGTLFKVSDVTTYFLFCYRLPLLETNPLPLAYKDIEEDDLIVMCKYDTYLGYMGDTLPIDFIEKVNRRWNEFYETSTRK